MAIDLGLEVVPCFYRGSIKSHDELTKWLETDSVLGGQKVEGVVVKNYHQLCMVGNLSWPSFGKCVRTDFKEKHGKDWKSLYFPSNKLEAFVGGFRTEARWNKAIQHLRERGELSGEPKDIGPLMKEIAVDLKEEEEENIKTWLFGHFLSQICRKAQSGLPEYYKQKLSEDAFAKGENA